MRNYMNIYCELEDVDLEEEVVDFQGLLSKLNRFQVNSTPFGDLLMEGGNVLADFKSKVRVVLDSSIEYYCNANLLDVVNLCLWVLFDGKLLRCDSSEDDNKVFEYLRDTIPGVFSKIRTTETQSYFTSSLVISEDFDFNSKESLEYLDKVFWGRIKWVIVPASVDAHLLLNELNTRNVNVHLISKESFATINESLENEIKSVGGKSQVYDFSKVYELYEKELSTLQTNLNYFSTKDKTLHQAGPTILRAIEDRYELIVKIYNTLSVEAESYKCLLVNIDNSNPYIARIIGSVCAVYSYFTGKRVIMDSTHAIYKYFESMLYDIAKGNMLSPYVALKRLSNIENDIREVNSSMFRGVLRKGDRVNPVVSTPLSLLNRQPCYLFPFTMFISYLSDKKLKSTTDTNNDMKILTFPKDRDIPINIKESSIDNIPEHECVKLVLPEEYYSINQLFHEDTYSHLESENKSFLLEQEGFRKDCASTLFEYLRHGDIGFEGDEAKVVLHDWILNPSLESLEIVKKYLPIIIDAPNWEGNLEYEDFTNLLHKILGFKDEEEYTKIFQCAEWSDIEVPTTTSESGISISKGSFKSVNYEKTEFYQGVCEMITSVLANESIDRYVTIHDIMLATIEQDGFTNLYIMYCPLNPEVLWVSSENGGIEDGEGGEVSDLYSVERDRLIGIPDTLLIFNDSEESAYLESNVDRMYYFDTSDFGDLEKDTDKSELDKHKALDAKFRIDNSELMKKLLNPEDFDRLEIQKAISEVMIAPNILDVSYIPEEYRDNYRKLCLWYISTMFLGFNSTIPTIFQLGDKSIGSKDYGMTVMQYLYCDYYNVIGSENLEELATIISPDKHLKYARVINPFGGILRDGNIFANPNKSKLFCTTSAPGLSRKYQYTNSRFISTK